MRAHVRADLKESAHHGGCRLVYGVGMDFECRRPHRPRVQTTCIPLSWSLACAPQHMRREGMRHAHRTHAHRTRAPHRYAEASSARGLARTGSDQASHHPPSAHMNRSTVENRRKTCSRVPHIGGKGWSSAARCTTQTPAPGTDQQHWAQEQRTHSDALGA